MAHFELSQRGGQVLFYDGMRFTRDGKFTETTNWRCAYFRNKCRARAITKKIDDRVMVKITNPAHICEPRRRRKSISSNVTRSCIKNQWTPKSTHEQYFFIGVIWLLHLISIHLFSARSLTYCPYTSTFSIFVWQIYFLQRLYGSNINKNSWCTKINITLTIFIYSFITLVFQSYFAFSFSFSFYPLFILLDFQGPYSIYLKKFKEKKTTNEILWFFH